MLWCIAIWGVNSRCTDPTSEFDPKQKSTTDGYEVVQSNDGINGIPQGVNFQKIPI
jgi:hypothetical protein